MKGATPVGLWWRSPQDPNRLVSAVDIPCGESAELMVFARRHDEPLLYFIWAPTSPTDATPKEPDRAPKLDRTIQFVVRINYADGRQFEFDQTVRVGDLDGYLHLECKYGGGGL
jgi:hypothetical protein